MLEGEENSLIGETLMQSSTIPTLAIGYQSLAAITAILDKTQPVYLASHIDSRNGNLPGQRIDTHTVIVTQPDTQNRVHYWRVVVCELVYHNGVAFAPDAEMQIRQVEQVRSEVGNWLMGEGCSVIAGMVALPTGSEWLTGDFR